MATIFIGILISLLVLLLIITFIMCSVPRLFYYVFDRKEWNQWKSILAMLDKFTYSHTVEDVHVFQEPSNTLRIYIWKNGLASVHNIREGECICCTFNTYMSKKCAQLLKAKYNLK